MTISHRYQNFGSQIDDQPISSDLEKLEDEKLQSFETGYQSGWDDAVAAQKSLRDNVTAEFARNLQSISFSYHEARSALTSELRRAVEPLLLELLPTIAHETLFLHLMEKIGEFSEDTLRKSLVISVPENRFETMKSLFEENLEAPFELVVDDSFADDQVFVKLGAEEHEINFDPWLEDMKSAIGSLFDAIAKE
jgi:flagellar assembly protein FliH